MVLVNVCSHAVKVTWMDDDTIARVYYLLCIQMGLNSLSVSVIQLSVTPYQQQALYEALTIRGWPILSEMITFDDISNAMIYCIVKR